MKNQSGFYDKVVLNTTVPKNHVYYTNTCIKKQTNKQKIALLIVCVCVWTCALAWGAFIPPDHQLAASVIELCCLYCSPHKLMKSLWKRRPAAEQRHLRPWIWYTHGGTSDCHWLSMLTKKHNNGWTGWEAKDDRGVILLRLAISLRVFSLFAVQKLRTEFI